LELAAGGEVEDVVAPVMQVVASTPDGTQRRVAGGDTREGDGFLRLEAGLRGGFAHLVSLIECMWWALPFSRRTGARQARRDTPRPPRGCFGSSASASNRPASSNSRARRRARAPAR